MIQTWKLTIPALTGDEERNAYIYLPNSYETEPERSYPVLYMFDGHNVFFDSHATYGKSWGMEEYMDRSGTQMIIAAVECNHSPDQGRLKEYSPFDFTMLSCGKIEGKGKITMDWMVHTFKREIDRRYRTIPDQKHTFIAGSSMGGLMSIYAILDYSSFFSCGAALSPSIWIAPEKLEDLIKNAHITSTPVLYMDYGENEFSYKDKVRPEFAKITSLLIEKGILLQSRIVPGGTHGEASWEKQIPFFMQTFLYEANTEA